MVRRPPCEILHGKTGIASILAWGTSKVMSRCPNHHCWLSVLLSLHGINVASTEVDRKGNLAANSWPFLTPALFYLSHLSSLHNNAQETVLPGSLKKKKKGEKSKSVLPSRAKASVSGSQEKTGWKTQSPGSLFPGIALNSLLQNHS